jgi:tRNA modification GTPase
LIGLILFFYQKENQIQGNLGSILMIYNSSLLNLIAKRDVAIVSEIAGTTRDVVEVHLNLEGFPVILYDTAGIRESNDPIEKEGVKRALKK